MKLINLKRTPLVLVLLSVVLTIGLVSWGYKQAPGKYQQSLNDTIPKKKTTDREKKVRDLDDVLNELDRADFNINMEKMQKEIADAMKKIDGDKIKMEIDKALMEVDMAKIQKEIQESLAKIDFKKIQEEVTLAMKEVDAAAIQKEVQESLAKIDWEKIKLEMEKVKDIDIKKITEEMKKVQEEMKELGPEMQKEMQKVKVEMEQYKGFIDELDNDGLINKKEAYKLKHKNGELFINGEKASEKTYNKYRNFLDKHKKFDIEKSDDDFDIDID